MGMPMSSASSHLPKPNQVKSTASGSVSKGKDEQTKSNLKKKMNYDRKSTGMRSKFRKIIKLKERELLRAGGETGVNNM
jgi:hypothetical protein